MPDQNPPAPFATVPVAPPPDAPLPDLSTFGMILNADSVVQVVMGLLVTASILTWTIGIIKGLETALAIRRTKTLVRVLTSAPSLMSARVSVQDLKGAERGLVTRATDELIRSAGSSLDSRDLANQPGLVDRLMSHFDYVEAAATRRLSLGMGFLATVGAISPFVGLFGTVWGIMNSFIGISKSQTTNLAIVAPGIAEALLATAFGLVAAIPAVILYNLFSRRIGACKVLLREASSALMRLISRDLDRHTLDLAALVPPGSRTGD